MRSLLALALLTFASPAYALSLQDSPLITPDTLPLPAVPEGALPWKLFQETKEKDKKITFPDGSYSFETSPQFSAKIKALDGKEVTLYGFMFPLEQSDSQSSFLLGPYPPSCPFHYHVPPSLIIEVRSKKPISFSWDGIKVKGALELAKGSNDVFYVLRNAAIVK